MGGLKSVVLGIVAVAIGGIGGLAPTQVRAQGLNDIGRQLGNQFLGNRPDPDAERRAYEAGRRDQDRVNRDRDAQRGAYEDRRRQEDRGRRSEEARRRDMERERADRQRAWAEDQRRQQPGRW